MASITNINLQTAEFKYSQDSFLDFVESNMELGKEAVLHKLFNSIKRHKHINTRHSCLDPSYFVEESCLGNLSTAKRQNLYEELSAKAIKKLCKETNHEQVKDIKNIVTVSCTGYQTPGLDFHLINNLPQLPKNIARYNIGAMGCYAGIIGLKFANQLSGKTLLLCLEFCSIHFQSIPVNFSNVVSNCLFADGLALLRIDNSSSENKNVSPISFHSAVIPNTQDKMSWLLRDTGFLMHLDPKVTKFIEGNIEQIVLEWLKEQSLKTQDIKGWVIHPGSYAILEAVRNSLELEESDLDSSKKILKNYGNMSSGTVFFILDDLLKNKNFSKGDKIVMMAFGPGLTAELCLLEVNEDLTQTSHSQ